MSRTRFAHCEGCGEELKRGHTLWEYLGRDLCGQCAAKALADRVSPDKPRPLPKPPAPKERDWPDNM